MAMDLEHIANIPVTTSAISSLFSEMKAGNQKVRNLELGGKIIRLKKGLYVVDPSVSHVPLSSELIANHIYAPSYVSMSSALRYYGLIPETVYITQSMMGWKYLVKSKLSFGASNEKSISSEKR